MKPLLLDPQAPAYYREHGYWLHRKPVFSPEKFQRLGEIFEEHLAGKGGLRADELDTPHFRDRRLLDFLLDDCVLDLVDPLIGPDIGLWSSHFICKEAGVGRRTPWHEDSYLWNGRFDKFDGIVTVWLALDGADRENGCMRVIPGTHNNGFSAYDDADPAENLFATQIKAELVDESAAVYFELARNQCSLHDSRIIHGAEPNTSTRRRCGYTMRYFSQTMRFIPEANPGFRIWHARGNNPHHNPVEN